MTNMSNNLFNINFSIIISTNWSIAAWYKHRKLLNKSVEIGHQIKVLYCYAVVYTTYLLYIVRDVPSGDIFQKHAPPAFPSTELLFVSTATGSERGRGGSVEGVWSDVERPDHPEPRPPQRLDHHPHARPLCRQNQTVSGADLEESGYKMADHQVVAL